MIGLRENSSRKTGVVYVRSTGTNQDGDKVLEYVRWVMVSNATRPRPAGDHVPNLPKRRTGCLAGLARHRLKAYDTALAGSGTLGDYAIGEKIDHVDGITVEEAEHQLATRLYQNTARVHFNQFTEPRPVRPATDLWRACDFARPGARLQGPGQRLPSRGDQRRPACRPAICRDTLFAWCEMIERRRWRAATMSVRCGCAPPPPRTAPRAAFPARLASDEDGGGSCSASIIGCSCRGVRPAAAEPTPPSSRRRSPSRRRSSAATRRSPETRSRR